MECPVHRAFKVWGPIGQHCYEVQMKSSIQEPQMAASSCLSLLAQTQQCRSCSQHLALQRLPNQYPSRHCFNENLAGNKFFVPSPPQQVLSYTQTESRLTPVICPNQDNLRWQIMSILLFSRRDPISPVLKEKPRNWLRESQKTKTKLSKLLRGLKNKNI